MSKRREITQEDLDALDEKMSKRSMVNPGELKNATEAEESVPIRVDQDIQYRGAVDNFITDTPQKFEQFKDQSRQEFRGQFASEDDFELFCMLPIPADARTGFLSRVKELNKSVVLHTT